MLIILLGLCLWIPAVAGWGLPVVAIRRRLLSVDTGNFFDIAEPVVGLALIGSAAAVINLFAPVGGAAIFVLLIGWVLLAVRIRQYGAPQFERRLVAGWGVWAIICALLSFGPITVGDAGLYHIQEIMWLRENVLPFGLANLHSRFGYYSTWFAVESIIEIPFLDQFRTNYFLASALLVFFWGAAAIHAVTRLVFRRSTRAHDLFMSLTPLIFLSWKFTPFLPFTSSDQLVILLTLVMAYFTLKAYDPDESFIQQTWNATVTAVFALTVKLSAAALVLFALFLIAAAIKRKAASGGWKAPAWSVAGLGLVMVIPWVIHGVIASGCAAFPVSSTCIYSLPWAVPQAEVSQVSAVILSWARQPKADPQKVLSSWNWVRDWWFEHEFLSGETRRLAALLGGGILLLALAAVARRRKTTLDRMAVGSALTASAVGMIYWFLTAPDYRFGTGYFWAAGLVILAIALGSFLPDGQPEGRLWRLMRIGCVVCVALVILAGIGGSVIDRVQTLISHHEYGLAPATVAGVPFDTDHTLDGIAVNYPRDDNKCWATPLPCTPTFDRNLRITRAPNGQFTAFFPPWASSPANY